MGGFTKTFQRYVSDEQQWIMHRDEYVKQALLYRDKAVLLLFDSPYALQVLVTISESAGDLSTAQRCVQYENSIRLLNRMNLLANKERDRLRRQFKPDMADRKQMESLSEWIDVGIKRVNGKSASFGCQEKLRSPG